jgi:hypothetical protein
MSKRERVLRAMNFQEVDRVPVYDILQNDAIIEHFSGERFSPGNGARITGLACGRALDMTRMADGPIENPRTFQSEDGTVHRQERWTSWIVSRPFQDLDGLVEWIKKEIMRTNQIVYDRAFAEQFHAYVCERLDRFREGDSHHDPAVLVVESLPGLTHMYHQTGHEMFAYLMQDDPSLLEEWLEALCQAELRRVRMIANPRLIPIALTADDIAYKTSLLFSPKWLRAVFLPRLKRLHEAWHHRDTFCIFHSDGNLWSILDDLLETGIDGLNPLETLAGMDAERLRTAYPGLVLTGGIDVSQLLTYGTPEEVRETCLNAIRATEGRGYFMGSTTELHWDVKLENAIAMFETAWGQPS